MRSNFDSEELAAKREREEWEIGKLWILLPLVLFFQYIGFLLFQSFLEIYLQGQMYFRYKYVCKSPELYFMVIVFLNVSLSQSPTKQKRAEIFVVAEAYDLALSEGQSILIG